MANKLAGRNDAFRRRGRAERSLRKAINKALLDAVGDDTERALSFDDTQLMKEMIGRKESLAESMMGESGKTLSDLDRRLLNEMSGRAGTVLGGLSDADRQRFREMAPSKPRMRPQEMEDGGLAGGQKKLDKNKDGKISGEDFKILRNQKKNTKVKKMKDGGQVCRGGGAAMRGTNFSGVR